MSDSDDNFFSAHDEQDPASVPIVASNDDFDLEFFPSDSTLDRTHDTLFPEESPVALELNEGSPPFARDEIFDDPVSFNNPMMASDLDLAFTPPDDSLVSVLEGFMSESPRSPDFVQTPPDSREVHVNSGRTRRLGGSSDFEGGNRSEGGEQQEVVIQELAEEEDINEYNEADDDDGDESTDDEAAMERWTTERLGFIGEVESGDFRLLTSTGANFYIDQRRRNIGLQNLFNYIRRRAFRRSGDYVRAVDDSDIPTLSVDQIQNMNFDRSLPERHQYLGNDLEVISGRTVHLDEEVLLLPFMGQASHVLLPKQSMPMYFNRQRDVALLRRVLDGDKTFAILPLLDRISARNFQPEQALGKIAIVAEVVMSSEDDLDNFKVIAEGRQRCEVLECLSPSSADGVKSLKVRILPDNNLEYNLFKTFDCRISPQNLSVVQLQQYSKATKVPIWMANANNVYVIMNKIRRILNQLFTNESGMAKLSEDASDFSFLVASFLPLSNKVKYKLLTCSCALQRLKLELEFLQKCEFLYCSVCREKLASVSEVIVMSNTGALASYVNPGGIIYETLTLNKIIAVVRCIGKPQAENSWFPGYAWTPASCNKCGSHLGWLFTRAKGASPDLKPIRFWGLSHSALSLDPSIEEQLLKLPISHV